MSAHGERGVGIRARLLVLAGAIAAPWNASCQEPGRPAPEELARAATRATLAVSASAAAALSGIVPLGAPAALRETPFGTEQPSSLCAPTGSLACALDIIDDRLAVELMTAGRIVPIRFIGWGADTVTGTVPPLIFLELSGAKKFYVPALRLTPRPDVARVLKTPALVNSGYDVLASLGAVDPGEYSVNVLQVNAFGTALSCDTRRKIRVE